MLKTMIKNTDWFIFFLTILLFLIGIVGIYSAGYNSEDNQNEYIKQLIWFGVSMIIVFVIWIIDNKYFELMGYIIYTASVVMLILVLFTNKIMGASSWFNLGNKVFIQPSEIMKIGYILLLSKIISKYDKNKLSKNETVEKWTKIMVAFAIPFVLILLQPDFGTAITFIAITFFILFISGIKYRYIFLILFLLLLLVPLVYNFVLNDVQKERILVFLDPTIDPLGSGYNAIQSKLAVGSGMIFGTGILKGTQTQYGYLPIKSSDFIFSVLSEEMGFAISAIIIIIFTILIVKILKLSTQVSNLYLKYALSGIAGMIFYHFVQNVGMTFGMLPITGVPLPFVSYGGSNLISNYIAIGIILNITARKEKNFLF